MSTLFDIGPLTWVKSEIDSSLERARAALRAFAGPPESRTELKACQTHLHQASGAVQIVGLEGVSRFFEETEQLVSQLESGRAEKRGAVTEVLERAIGAIGKYLSELLDGNPDQPLRLYPLYRELALARGAQAPSQADLYFPDLSLGPPPREHPVSAPARGQADAFLRAQRARFQRGLLRWLREPGNAQSVDDMRAAVDGIESMQAAPGQRALWWAAGAFYDALALGDLGPEPEVRQFCTRIEQQMRRMSEGPPAVAERLLREVLYWVARAGSAATAKSDRVRVVKLAYRLEDTLPAQSSADLTFRGPLALALREQITAAKDAWNKYATGAESALASFARHMGPLGEQTGLLANPALAELARELAACARTLQAEPARMCEPVAMEVATALLMIETALEGYHRLPPDFAQQAGAMAERLGAVVLGRSREGALPTGPLIGELTRRAQEKLAFGSALAEMQGNLQTIEQTLDGYFRDPARSAELGSLEPVIRQVAGALELLGEGDAQRELERAAQRIRGFASASVRPPLEAFEEVAHILSGLGFYIDALRHGKADFAAAMQPVAAAAPPEAARAARTTSVEVELGQQKRAAQALFEQLLAAPQDQQLREALRQRLRAIQKDADLVADKALGESAVEALAGLERLAASEALDHGPLARAMAGIAPPAQVPSADAQRLRDASDETIDQELLAIFLEEAVGVLAAIAENIAVARAQPASIPHLAAIRRSFHTLKGSGRMVGLTRLCEAAQAVEQVLYLWLQEERSATPELLQLVEYAHATFSAWVDRLRSGEPQPDPAPVIAAAARVRRGERAAPAAVPAAEATFAAAPDGETLAIGATRISPSLYSVFVNEARQHLDALERELASAAAGGAIREELIRVAHTLAGICGTVQMTAMHALGHALENALRRLAMRPAAADGAAAPVEIRLLADSVAALRDMYGAVLQRRAPAARADLAGALDRLGAAPAALRPAPQSFAVAPPGRAAPHAEEPMIERRLRRIEDEIDQQLLPTFLEEAAELAPQIGALLRDWRAEPGGLEHAKALQRTLHTLKGSARMAGVMSLGELMHHMESRIENAVALNLIPAQLIDDLEASYDRMGLLLERLHKAPERVEEAASAVYTSVAPVAAARAPAAAGASREAALSRAVTRVRADMLEKLVNQAGEVAIARTRIEGEVRALKTALGELTENVSRLRGQLREIEIQADSQLRSGSGVLDEQDTNFDPLEFDRYTRFQELTRLMAEGVNDVATVQQNLSKVADDTEAALLAQARLNRELQQDLMRVRMVPLGSIAERLHRLVRQTSKELGKRVNLDIGGANVELERSVLERMVGPIEHLLRNAVMHGIEPPAERAAKGKPEIGEIRLDVRQEGQEVSFTLGDDGAGLDLEKIRAKALAHGLLRAGEPVSEQGLAELIFVQGFTTAERVTEIAGRGVGMDVVKDEVGALAGRIELGSAPGQGAKFTIRLPLTTAVIQTVLVKSGARICALPAVMVEQVQQLRGEQLAKARAAGNFEWAGRRYPLVYLPELLGEPGALPEGRRYHRLLLVRSGADSVALLVDDMVGNQEVVVKNIGPQLSRVPGVAGATVLGNGEIVLIINPVPLARRPVPDLRVDAAQPSKAAAAAQPRIMVVDDSLTVRKITGRLLSREGYRVLTAKDGVEALEQLQEVVPDVMLVDIEMPRMDGFDLTRHVRAEARLRHVPIIIITSRTADKHRNYALGLGANAFLGKPYQEDELLGHIAGFVGKGTI